MATNPILMELGFFSHIVFSVLSFCAARHDFGAFELGAGLDVLDCFEGFVHELVGVFDDAGFFYHLEIVFAVVFRVVFDEFVEFVVPRVGVVDGG